MLYLPTVSAALTQGCKHLLLRNPKKLKPDENGRHFQGRLLLKKGCLTNDDDKYDNQ
jgi:hypothetical protein